MLDILLSDSKAVKIASHPLATTNAGMTGRNASRFERQPFNDRNKMKTSVLFIVFLSALAFGGISKDELHPWKNQKKVLVLLLEWSDRPSSINVSEVEEAFFGESLSLKKFFHENSSGTYDISGEVMPWRSSSLKWEELSSCQLNTIVQEAWQVFSSDIEISSYDSDSNGKIDHLFILHSGRIRARSDMESPCVFMNFSKADHTAILQSQGAWIYGNHVPIGYYLHEAGHQYFNLPDLYGDHHHGHYGIGMWGIMGLGAWGVHNQIPTEDMFRYPSHFEPKSKEVMGWGHFQYIDSRVENVTLRPVETSGDIVVVKNLQGGENFYLEYRSAQGFSENYLGHGLLIWKGYKLVQADGRDDLNSGTDLGRNPTPPIDENFGDASDPFPGSGDVRYYHDQETGIILKNIRLEEGVVKLDVQFP